MFGCKVCDKKFDKARDLTNHIRVHHKQSIESYWNLYSKPYDFDYKCEICKTENKRFLSITQGYSPICTTKKCFSAYIQSKKQNTKNINNNKYVDVDCKICGKQFKSILSLTAHLFGHTKNSCHNNLYTYQSYYDKFILNPAINLICPICNINKKYFKGMLQGYSNTCKDKSCIGKRGNEFITNREERKIRTFINPIKCEVCNEFNEGLLGLASHIQQHQDTHLTIPEYYDKYLLTDLSLKKCQFCNNPTVFQSLSKGYSKTCQSSECTIKLIKESKHNNHSRIGSGYSMISIDKIFNPIIEKYNIPKDKCQHALLNREFYHYVGWIEKYKKRKIGCFSYDFCILDSDYKTPLLICEFQGGEFHIKKEDVWKRRRDKDFYGNYLLKTYRKDYEKEQYIKQKYPHCKYMTIWEDDIEIGLFELENQIKIIFPTVIHQDNIIIDGISTRNKIPGLIDTECKLCWLKFRSPKGLTSHLRQSHDYNNIHMIQDYYDKYMLTESKLCPICKVKEKKFISFSYGYSSTCLNEKDGEGNNLTCRFKWMNTFQKFRFKSLI